MTVSGPKKTLANARPVARPTPPVAPVKPTAKALNAAAAARFDPAKAAKVAMTGERRQPTRDEAITRARELLEGAPSSRTSGTSVITEDAPDVNDAGDVSGKRGSAALLQLGDNQQLEAEALLKLSPADRSRYLSVKDTLLEPSEGKPNGDPVGALALQTLLLEGKLPGAKDLTGQDTLLGNLSRMNRQELGAGIDRQQLLSDVVQEVAVPSAVNQRSKGTCVPTSIEIQLLQTNPAEYARLVGGLASTAGEVTTAGGDTLKVEPDALTDSTGRSISQRLLAPALMEVANGRADYDNTDDRHEGGGIDGQKGLTASQADVLLESLYGRPFAFHRTESAREKEAGTDFVLSELGEGRSVVVGLKWGEGGHKVLAVGTETRDGVDYVKIINPWGREESIPREDFEARLRNVNFDPRGPAQSLWEKVTSTIRDWVT